MSREDPVPGAALVIIGTHDDAPPSISTSRLDRAGSGAEVPELPGPFGPTDRSTPRTESAPSRTPRACMDTPPTYFHWGFILISVPNLVVIGWLVLLFAIALFAPCTDP